MMYFQIAVSPVEPAKKQQTVSLEDIAVLKLAPFTANPKIFFENVAVGEMETKKLVIQNPNAYKAQLRITKLLPADRFVTLNWKEAEIEPQDEITLELTWAPKEEGGWRDVLSILDNKNVNRNVPIIFKSISKKGKRRTGTKQASKSKPTVVSVPAVKKFRSPKHKQKKRSPLKEFGQVCMPKTYQCDNCHNNIHITMCSPLKKKTNNLESNKENSPIMFQQKLENLSPPIILQQKSDNASFSKLSFSEKLNRMDNSSFFSSPSTVNFKCDNILQTPIRRETYAITKPVINNVISPDLNDSLEIEKKINNLALTPEVSTKYSQRSHSAESFIQKLNIDSTPVMAAANRSKSADHYLVQKLLSDSFAFTTATVTKKQPHFQFVLNETDVLDDVFYPNNCSTENKVPAKINRNNSSTPKELFKPNSTYELSPRSRKNTSPQNLSGGTYNLSNISSSSTYAILSPDDVHDRIRELSETEKPTNYAKISTSSPVLPYTTTNQFHATSNYLNFSGINAKAALSCITEEDQPSETSIRNSSIRSDVSFIGMKRKSEQQETIFTVSPPKRAFIKPRSPKPLRNTTWSKKLEKTEKIRRKSISTLRLNLSKSSSKSNISDISSSSVNISQTICNIDPFLIAAMYNSNTSVVNTNLDPFISSTLYYDETWLDKQMKELKKWLNALLTPPSELAAKAESRKVDVAKLWQDCVKKELIYAPSKEKVSSKYHTNNKLEILRKSAKNLFHSLEIRNVWSKVTVIIENKQLSLRDDKNLHLDVGLQSHILTLLLCYNPLWLRIGLETVYNETIPLESNSDVIGLSTFIMLRFFRCPDLMPKNKQASHMKYLPAYAAGVKKFTLKKFLMLVYFLDQAKTNKLISHDPCLFCKDAPVKESKELLLSFSRELISAVGDITKFLRRLGYEVSHKQSYIDEFDYAVKNLGVDLRDGIRLTKVMEVILLRNDLTNQLRGPAISRLQKIHNVKLALDSLLEAGYMIAGDISSKDIVDGHKEKTLSLLWQIIYKFQAPRFTKAASKLQIWWRSLTIVIKRRILDRPRQLRINAATKILQYYRSWKLMQKERSQFLLIKKSVITIQRFTRSTFLVKRDRLQHLLKRQAVIIIQQKYRALKLMKQQRTDYLELKNSTVLIQQKFRANFAMKQTREHYLKLKETVIKIQRNFRSKQIMKEKRNSFLQKRSAAVVIQSRFKATQQMKIERSIYVYRKNVVIKLQQRFRATMLMRETRSTYLQQRKCIVLLQQRYRANKLMKTIRKSYLEYRQAVTTIQQRFRANLVMKQTRETYLLQRKSAITIHQNFRAYLAMKNYRESYIKLKQATIFVQERFKANMAMKTTRKIYLQQKNAAILIQQKFKAYLEMKTCRENYLKLKQGTITIQQRFRAYLAMKDERENYLYQRKSAVFIQQKFRAHVEMKKCREKYLELKKVVGNLQQIYRANTAMKQARNNYVELKNAAVLIQQRFRATKLMKETREIYLRDRKTIIDIQQKYRAKLAMKQENNHYLRLKKAAVTVQRRFRANQLMKKQQTSYLKLKESAVIMQRIFRANTAMKIDRENYLKQRQLIIKIQFIFRARQEMKITREKYLRDKGSIIKLQQRFRANIEMKKQRQMYLENRKSITLLQQKYRAILAMRKDRASYLKIRNAIITLQQHFRANVAMKNQREKYLQIRRAVQFVQERFRANVSMKKERENYLQIKRSAIVIQQRFKAYLAMKTLRAKYILQRKLTVIIQRHFRANLAMKQDRKIFMEQKIAAVIIQRWFRNVMITKKQEKHYLLQKKSVCIIQQRFREYLLTKKQRTSFLEIKKFAVVIQNRFKSYLLMKQCRTDYVYIRKTVITIQTYYRSYLMMKKCRQAFLQKKEAAIKIQRYFRAFLKKKSIQKQQLQIRAVVKIQCWVRMHAAKKQLAFLRENSKDTQEKILQRKLNKAAVKIQSLWRGYRIRKVMCRKLAMIRQRSVDAANNALPESTIGQRNLDAIDILMYQTSMKEIIRALTILDFTTRLFPNLCIEVCNEITERLYILLVCTNRSVPDMDASVLCVSVLINLYKFQPTSAAVWKKQYIERLLSLLLHWSDKDSVLFPYVCTLIWLFTQKPEYCEVILAEKNAAKILAKTYQQCERRQKMLTRMRNAPSTMHVKGQKDVFPSLLPDWGIINMNRPRVFKNPVFAVKCLLKKLNISLNI